MEGFEPDRIICVENAGNLKQVFAFSVWRSRSFRRWVFLLLIWGVFLLAVIQLGSGSMKQWVQNQTTSQTLDHRPSLLKSIFSTHDPSSDDPVNFIPQIDNSNNGNEDAIINSVQTNLPSLPIVYWNKTRNRPMFYKNETCARYPSIYELEFNNIYWQTLRTSNGTFQFYGAYYDVRRFSKIGPAVRILGMIDRIDPTVKTYCQLWFENHKEPVFIKTLEYKYIWYKKWGNYKQGIYQPYLIACQIPQPYQKLVPVSVSVVEKPCNNAINNLRVIYNLPPNGKKKGFAVCVKGLDFLHEDLSVRLVEWIELLTLLGNDKVFFYKLQVHPNISKVLDYYESKGRVSVTPLTLPGGQPNFPGFQHLYLKKKVNHKRQNELIPYNDCLYKNLYTYEYVALLDIDEVIMPIKQNNWSDLMKDVLPKAFAIKNETRASYNFRNVYFLDDLSHAHGWFKDIPKYMHMLQHVYRTYNYTKPNQYIKCFHNPERALTLHNHFPLACLSQGCTSYPVETTDGQLQHYRADCVKTLKETCEKFRLNSVMDTTIWKYKKELIKNTYNTLSTLGFFKSS